MLLGTRPIIFAQSYSAGDYSASTYQNGSATSSSGGGSSGSVAGGVLSNTGFDVLLAATLACTIIFVALVIHLWRRSPKQQD